MEETGNFLDKDMKRENLEKNLGRNSCHIENHGPMRKPVRGPAMRKPVSGHAENGLWGYAETDSWAYAETSLWA